MWSRPPSGNPRPGPESGLPRVDVSVGQREWTLPVLGVGTTLGLDTPGVTGRQER